MTMTISQIRRARLRQLIRERFGGRQRALADALDMKGSQISRWLGPGDKARQAIHENSARAIEETLRLPPGWMDIDPTKCTEIERSENDLAPSFVNSVKSPILGNIHVDASGSWKETSIPFGIDDIEKEEYVYLSTDDPDAYVIRVKGENLAPFARSGWLVCVEPNAPIEPGCYVVVHFCHVRRPSAGCDDGDDGIAFYVGPDDGIAAAVREYLYERDGHVFLQAVTGPQRFAVPLDAIARIERIGGVLLSATTYQEIKDA